MPFKFQNSKAEGSAEIKTAIRYMKQYVVMLMIMYIGFVVMTSMLGGLEDSNAVLYIEFTLVGIIMGLLGFVIYKLIHGIRLLKKDETK